ncbi:hypothetical protein B0T19DRAFT_437712 [Cercophora scortea]|uniref:Uncharacterized protein n=1 Tax=Cercophora scortea TaxID=314031 RepID=A0AAE0MLI0_9PEZI|nr:hypothetical protein B0T19DRAFT_437712 [Cercophora scortea]
MRFTTLLLSSLFAVLGLAEPITTTTTASAPAPQNSEQAAILACLNACKAGDVACTSKCIAVPNPDASQVNSTNTCVANCNQGTGTETDNLNYANCVEGCIGKYYFTDSGTPAPATAVPAPAPAGGNSNVGGSSATGTGTVVSPTGTGTASGTGANKPSQTTQGDAATHTTSGVATATSNAAVGGGVGSGRSAVVGVVVGGFAALFAL